MASNALPGKFDVIVVGAGPAGSAAAYLLAKAGLKTLIIERGRGAGTKELFGGKIYAAPLREVWPELDKEAPIHRWVGRERISFVAGDRVSTVEFKLGRRVAFTTYLTEMAKWMAGKAVDAGAILVDEVRVDEIVVRDGKVVGVRSGPDIVEADVVIDAEGVNRMLLEKLGLAEKISPDQVALGVKEVINVGKKNIQEKLMLDDDEGMAWFMVGDVTNGLPGGGFLYTMKDTIALGLVLHVGKAYEAAKKGLLEKTVPQMVEALRTHNFFSKIWGDADVLEYGAHLTIEGGLRFMPRKLYMPGFLVVGDAAGFLLNTGYTIRGVDFAVYSGKLAAETVIEALNNGGPTGENLKRYEDKVKASFIYKELVKHRGIEKVMEDPLFFTKLPALLNTVFAKLYEADYEEPTLLEAVTSSLEESEISLSRFMIKMLSIMSKL
ncbi:MAG: FAD-dependent oxidoreductase [Desulfurococcales archaeon]|nr:FAD-dependent oxidoreductase [Desulfurococcales archaeon]